MKKILVLFSISFIALTGNSQIKFGFKAGLSSSSIKLEKFEVNNTTFESVSDAVVGFQAGVALQIKLAGLYLQPELLYSTSGGNVRLTNISGSRLVEQNVYRLDLPVIVGKKLGPVRLGLGPVFSSVLSSKSEITDIQDYDDKFKKATIGYQLDLGLDISKIFIDLKYEGNLSKMGDAVTVMGTSHEFDSRARQIILSIGIFL